MCEQCDQTAIESISNTKSLNWNCHNNMWLGPLNPGNVKIPMISDFQLSRTVLESWLLNLNCQKYFVIGPLNPGNVIRYLWEVFLSCPGQSWKVVYWNGCWGCRWTRVRSWQSSSWWPCRLQTRSKSWDSRRGCPWPTWPGSDRHKK